MKSQSSTEFMIFIGIAIIILMVYFAIAHTYLNLTYKQRDIISGQDLAKQIKNEINLASRVEDGYIRTLTLPSSIGNRQYTINMEGREIIVTMDGLDYVELLTTDVSIQNGPIQSGAEITIIKTENEGVEVNFVNP